MAFPSIFTSTLPLDYNGYNRGIGDRETCLAEVMKRNGFHTIGFSTVNFLGDFYHYNRGFDELFEIYNIKRFWKSFDKNFISYYTEMLQRDVITYDEFYDLTNLFVRDSFEYLREFCEEKDREIKENGFHYNPIIHEYDYRKLREMILEEFGLYKNNPQEYLLSEFGMKRKYDRIINIARYGESPFGIIMAYMNLLVEDIMLRLQSKMGFGYSYILKRYDHFISAEYLRKCITEWIDSRSNKTPFFLWAHFLDIHEGNYTSGKVQYPPILGGVLKKRFVLNRDEMKQYCIEYATKKAIRYVDDQLGVILHFLKAKGLLENTLLVITSDHGMERNGIKRSGHKATLFYDEFIKIPMMFCNPGLEPMRVTNICSHLDLAPTILDLMGIETVGYFKGVPVYSSEAEKREFIISENNGRGPTDLKRKKINIAVRTSKYKYIGTEGNALDEVELYDMEEDPEELRNLSGDRRFYSILEKLDSIARNRFDEIRRKLH